MEVKEMDINVTELFNIRINDSLHHMCKEDAKKLYEELGKALFMPKEIIYIPSSPYYYSYHRDYPKFEWLHSSYSNTKDVVDTSPGGACVEK